MDPTDVDGDGSYESVVLDLAQNPEHFGGTRPEAPPAARCLGCTHATGPELTCPHEDECGYTPPAAPDTGQDERR